MGLNHLNPKYRSHCIIWWRKKSRIEWVILMRLLILNEFWVDILWNKSITIWHIIIWLTKMKPISNFNSQQYIQFSEVPLLLYLSKLFKWELNGLLALIWVFRKRQLSLLSSLLPCRMRINVIVQPFKLWLFYFAKCAQNLNHRCESEI